MSLERNILANYVGSGAAALAPLFALPWYLSALGSQQFGFVGLVTTLQAVLNLLDAGMSQALVREVALRSSSEGATKPRTATLLYGFERIYWTLALVIGIALALLAGPIVHHWLRLDDINLGDGHAAVWGAGAIFAALFPGSLYRSLLVGMEHQVTLNRILLATALLRHGGAVIAVTVVPSLTTYLVWQVAAGLIETLWRARAAWRATGTCRTEACWQGDTIRSTWPAIASLTIASGLGALTMQLDKVLLSKLVPIVDFGYYVIAASAAAGVLQLVYPLMQAALPYALRLKDRPADLRRLYARLFMLIGLVASLGLTVYAVEGQLLLGWWLKDLHVVDMVYPLLGWLLVGAIVNAFYNVGYVHWLVHGRIASILQVNLLTCALCLGAIPMMVSHFGMVGATSGWLIINVCGFIASLPALLKVRHEK